MRKSEWSDRAEILLNKKIAYETVEFILNYFDTFTERVIERRVLELKAL